MHEYNLPETKAHGADDGLYKLNLGADGKMGEPISVRPGFLRLGPDTMPARLIFFVAIELMSHRMPNADCFRVCQRQTATLMEKRVSMSQRCEAPGWTR